jgi:pilus assembly protein Flp/PilA
MKFSHLLLAFAHDKRAVTAIEYGVLAASIALGIGTIFGSDSEFMLALKKTFGNITEQLGSASE